MAEAPPEGDPRDEAHDLGAHAPRPPARPARARGVLDPILSHDTGVVSALASADDDDAGREDDRWAHRRGEPRVLALLWSVYLFGAAISTVMRIPVLGMTDLRFVQNASRMLLLLIAVGLVVLWPMVRLSQAPPRRPLLATALDLALLNATLQAVVWPLTWLGKWPLAVTGGVALMLLSWSMLVGGAVACGTARRAGVGRTIWMILCVALVGGAPALAMLAGASGGPIADELALASPLTAVYALTTGPSGLSPTMDATTWTSAWAPLVAALPLWLLAGATIRLASARRGAG
ncbi:MAG: hypothetical protein ACF8QF_13270 [Phycisphaerales bacterium]